MEWEGRGDVDPSCISAGQYRITVRGKKSSGLKYSHDLLKIRSWPP